MLVPICALAWEMAMQTPSSLRNIRIAQRAAGRPPCEPSIAINPKDPRNIVAGVIMDRAIYTRDGGATWNDVRLTSPFGVAGDPTIIADAKGNFHYFHLSNGGGERWLDRIVCQSSVDGGATWTSGASIGENHPADQDKQWAAAHPVKSTLACTWTQFDKYGSTQPGHESNILFSLSADGGANWSKAQKINDISGDCVDDDGTTEGAVPAIDRQGRIFVAWSNQGTIWFDRTYDDGKTWLPFDRAIARHYGGWNMAIPGINRCNGMPVLMVDNGLGPRKGTLYLVWADQRKGATDTDILFMKSSDQGDTWSAPLTINKDDSKRHQFFPWLAVDSTTGHLYVVYYDRRAYEDNQTDVYLAYSTDGGNTFSERRISASPFVPRPDRFFGDYTNISASGGIVAPIWARMDDGETTVWGAVIRHADLAGRGAGR